MHHNDDNAGIVKYKYWGHKSNPTSHVKDRSTNTRKADLEKSENFVLVSGSDKNNNGEFWPQW